ncbi:MAG TPA: pyridoxal-dependent decarboxylase [Blastocatellia bacterium]|nr:pyridoxal-dependent decarboxylase [Blastocatellia bacterium]
MNPLEPQLPAAQLGDMSADDFRRYGHQVVDWIADYLSHPERYPVLSQNKPGQVKDALPSKAPRRGEAMEALLADLDRVIVPGVTHWNHPGFFAYFAISGSAPGILGEMLTAAFNVNAMLWRTSPSATELEEVTLEWLRQMIGLPSAFGGVIYDTASISSLCAIAAAREAAGVDVRNQGLGASGAKLRMYASEHVHSSVDKAAITLGIGQAGLRKIVCDDEYRMDPNALARAIDEDRAAGWRPFCVAATAGTTSSTSIDPVPAIADICEREGLWLHVDAAYGGSAAVVPEMRWVLDGCDRADSLVINPHKGLFVPVDLSVLFCRQMEVLRRAFSLVPEYLRTGEGDEVKNFMDYGPQLGRRFRALKLWFVMRYFGVEGLRDRIRTQITLAREFANWVDQSEHFERLAPVPFSLVCFRARPSHFKTEAAPALEDNPPNPHWSRDVDYVDSRLDLLNERLLEEVNRRGTVFLSHTKLNGRFTLRLAIGNIRTTRNHVKMAWDELNEVLSELSGEGDRGQGTGDI